MRTRIRISDQFTFGKLLRFAVPSIVMVICMSLYGVVDGLFVSNFVGDDAFAAVNLFMPIFYIAGSVGMLLGSGGCAFVAKLFGERNEHAARRHFTGLVILTAGIGGAITLSTVWSMPQIAHALGARGEVAEHCALYGTIMIGGLIPFMLQSFFQYFFAVADSPKLGLAITACAGVTNMVGDFLLMYVFKLGVAGAAIATVVGEVVGGIIPLFWVMSKKRKRLYLSKPRFDLKAIGKVCANGSSEFLTNVTVSLVSVIYNFQLLKYIGDAGVIAYGTIMYVSFIFIGCYLGFSVGTAPIISYNYGAKNTDEMKNVFKKSVIFYAVAAVIMTSVSVVCSQLLAYIFVGYDAELLSLTTTALQLFSFSFLISGFNIYASAFFTALNNGFISALVSTLRTLVFQVIAVFIMPLVFGLNGIWLATVAAELLSLSVSIACIFKYRKRYGYM